MGRNGGLEPENLNEQTSSEDPTQRGLARNNSQVPYITKLITATERHGEIQDRFRGRGAKAVDLSDDENSTTDGGGADGWRKDSVNHEKQKRFAAGTFGGASAL